MDKNFKVRVLVGTMMFVVSIVSLYVFDSIPFKIIFGLFALIAAIELLSFFKKGFSAEKCILVIFEITFLICSTIFVAKTDVSNFWYIIWACRGMIFLHICSGK